MKDRFLIHGIFKNKETKLEFGYYIGVISPLECVEGATHTIFVGDVNFPYRAAVIKKTVAYVAVDEDEYGKPVWEKWLLGSNKQYVMPGELL